MKKIERIDWFTTGLKILSSDGFSKITIENICDILKVTKGSFYHHFKNMDGYIDSLMEYWMEANTNSLIRKIEEIENPIEKIQMLNKTVLLRSHKSEQVIRAWSFSNDIVRKYVVEVDKIRIDYTAMLKVKDGENSEKSKLIAALEYACLIGIQQLYPDISKEKQEELYEIFNQRIIK